MVGVAITMLGSHSIGTVGYIEGFSDFKMHRGGWVLEGVLGAFQVEWTLLCDEIGG